MLRTLLVSLALGLGAQSAPKPSPADIAADQLDVAATMIDGKDVNLSVLWVPCGFENAFYSSDTQTVVLCLELDDEPGPAFVVAHETGHALVDQLHLTLDDDPWAAERAADEIGAMALLKMDRPEDVVGGAKLFLAWAAQSPETAWTWDQTRSHPPEGYRARELLCLVDGYENGSAPCIALYSYMRVRWAAAGV